MSVKIRERVNEANKSVTWQADIHVKLLDGRRVRERCRVPGVTSRSAALKWAHERERWLILHGHEEEVEKKKREEAKSPKMPTLAAFCERWMAEYVVANRLKPSTVATKEVLVRAYLVPALGEVRLDAIAEADIQRLKARYAELRPSTVNNMLTCLATILKAAIEWKVIREMPRIRKLKKGAERFEYYEEAVFERLVAAASADDPRCFLVVLLGGDAGLRAGEMLALRWEHCDFGRGVLNIVENEWLGHVGTPKGDRTRQVVMTRRLREALVGWRGAEGGGHGRVLLRDGGEAATKRVIDGWLWRAQRAAMLPKKGPHVLRHTFCSRLAARGAAPKAIQELAGHVHSRTTDRYLHLAPSALKTAIDLLDPESMPRVAGSPAASGQRPRHGRGTGAPALEKT